MNRSSASTRETTDGSLIGPSSESLCAEAYHFDKELIVGLARGYLLCVSSRTAANDAADRYRRVGTSEVFELPTRIRIQPLPPAGRLLSQREFAVFPHLFLNRTDSQLPSELHPPSTVSVAPFTNPLSLSSARKAIARATSSGRANRPIGTLCVISASI